MSRLRFLLHKIALWEFKPEKVAPETINKLPLCWYLQKDDTHGQKYTKLYQKRLFTWAGHTVENVSSPFAYPPHTPKQWITYAHGFDWLFYTHATLSAFPNTFPNTFPHVLPNAFHTCLQWILQWHQDFGHTHSSTAWDLHIVAQRLINWLQHYENLTGDAANTDRKQFQKIIYIQYQFLCYFRTTPWVARQKPSPPEYIQILTSIICASLALGDDSIDIKPPYHEITNRLDDIMDADGFVHKDLPTHITVLKSVLVLRATLHKIKTDTPEILDSYINTLDSYIDKMWKVVQFFYNINKDFAHMAGETALNHQYYILKQQCSNERKIVPSLNNSQYFVIHTDIFTVYMDAMPRTGHHTDTGGVLGLTLHSKTHPIFVACGYSPTMGNRCKYSATHNTLTLNDTNCVTLGKKSSAINVSATQKDSDPSHPWHILDSMHTGYKQKFGVQVERKIGVKQDGSVVQGRDSVIFVGDFATAEPLYITIRFHLHPNIRAVQLQNNDLILTAKKTKQKQTKQVVFNAKNCTVSIEPSYHIDAHGIYKPTEQIVLQKTYTPQVLDADKVQHIDWTLYTDKQ